jgi:hypothetical protein
MAQTVAVGASAAAGVGVSGVDSLLGSLLGTVTGLLGGTGLLSGLGL